MSQQKDTVRKFYEAIVSQADISVVEALLTEDFSLRGSLGHTHHGHKGFMLYMDFVRRALGHYQCDILDMIEEDNKVWARMHYSGIHQGELFGHAPTHGKLKWEGVALFAFRDGRISELWALGDVQSVIKQLSRYLE